MLQYLIILLDDTSVSYCHYENKRRERRLMAPDVLRRGIVWAMKENLNIQFVYPSYQLPEEHRRLIETIDHTKIGPETCGEELDVTVTDGPSATVDASKCYLWRCTLEELSARRAEVADMLARVSRLNIVLADVGLWKDADLERYKGVLEELANSMAESYKAGRNVQLNLLTDRLILDTMNNCGAGDTSITLAPDGRFYLCPAYYDGQQSVGSLTDGLDIRNQQLYKLDHAPICRRCDAYQCRRCIWMNERLTMDCNTPSHQQCVAAHLERNASRQLQQKMLEMGVRLEHSREIPKISYLDPFEVATRWK